VNSLRLDLLVFALMGSFVWLLSGTPSTQAQEQPLVVDGLITNGTQDGNSVEDLTVIFHLEGADVHEHIEATTDGEGQFKIDGIRFDPTLVYGVSVNYGGALYGTDVDLSAGPPPPIALTVYDATDSDEVVYAASASLLFAGVDTTNLTVTALEIVAIVNDSDHAYVPGDEPMNLLRFGLPPGARNLQVDTRLLGANFLQVDRGFALLASVPPGEYEVMYTYEFPYSESEMLLSKSMRYGAENLRVLVPEELFELSSDELGSPETVVIGERLYNLLQVSDVPREGQISLRLEGLPQPSLADRTGRRLDGIRFEYAAPISLALLMASLIGYAFWKRMIGLKETPITSEVSDIAEERTTLLQMIEELEGGLGAGTLDEEDYRRRRRVLEARLASLG
jgi:hypothetical protein